MKDNNNNLYKIKVALTTLKEIANTMGLVFPVYKIRGDMFEITNFGYPKKEWIDNNFLKDDVYIANKNFSVTQGYLDTLIKDAPDLDMF